LHITAFVKSSSKTQHVTFQFHPHLGSTRPITVLHLAKKRTKKSRQQTKIPLESSPIFLEDPKKVPTTLPKLLVFDLDNTLWTPELYQIRTNKNVTPQIGKEIRLFPGAQSIVADFVSNPSVWQNTQFAIASRTDRIEWAEELLHKFEAVPDVSLSHIFRVRQIFPGSKRKHFEELQNKLNIPYNEMIFFDDDAHLNLREIETMGVLCSHCPKGINVDLFRRTLWQYSDMKKNKKAWMGITVNARSLPKR